MYTTRLHTVGNTKYVPLKVTQYQMLTSLLNEIKQNQQFPLKSMEVLSQISDEIFAIFGHIILLSNQLSLLIKKGQPYDRLLKRSKISLSNEIASFFDSIYFLNPQKPKLNKNSSLLTYERADSFSLTKNSKKISTKNLDLGNTSFVQYDELSNENIIEKIKKKIETKKLKKQKKLHLKSYSPRVQYSTYNNYSIHNRYTTKSSYKKNKKSKAPLKNYHSENHRNNLNYSFNKNYYENSFIITNEKLQQEIFDNCGVVIKKTGPKPSNYAHYLLCKSKCVIDDYKNMSDKKVRYNSFTDYSSLKARPKSSCGCPGRYTDTFSED